MVVVEFLGPIDKEPVKVAASSLKELADLLSKDKETQKWLAKCAVAVNDTLVSDPAIPLKPGDRISILPPVCGG